MNDGLQRISAGSIFCPDQRNIQIRLTNFRRLPDVEANLRYKSGFVNGKIMR